MALIKDQNLFKCEHLDQIKYGDLGEQQSELKTPSMRGQNITIFVCSSPETYIIRIPIV